jgi:hypothetical protein
MKTKIYIQKLLACLVFFPLMLSAEGIQKGAIYDPSGTGGALKLEPKVRVMDEQKSRKRIPIDMIRPYLVGAEIVSEHELEVAPYILAPEGEHLISGTGATIYARGFLEDPDEGRSYAVYRKGDAYKDPDTGEILGIEAKAVGLSQVSQVDDPVTLVLTKVNREVLIGDRLLPEDEPAIMDFYPTQPTIDFNSKIIAVYDGVTQIGQYNVVVIKGGYDVGLVVGNTLNVYQAGQTVVDPYAAKKEKVTLPDVFAGQMMVFKVFDKLSLAIVLEALRPMHVLDKVKTM